MALRRRKQNPGSAMPIILMAGAGVAAYLAYTNGWFGTTATAVAAPPPPPSSGPGSTGNQVAKSQIVGAPAPPPPLGTIVHNGNDLAAQLAAKYMYVIPDPSLSALSTQLASAGYQLFSTSDSGNVYVRPDIANAVNADIANRVGRATSAGASQQSITNAAAETYAQIQQLITSQGLTGLGWR